MQKPARQTQAFAIRLNLYALSVYIRFSAPFAIPASSTRNPAIKGSPNGLISQAARKGLHAWDSGSLSRTMEPMPTRRQAKAAIDNRPVENCVRSLAIATVRLRISVTGNNSSFNGYRRIFTHSPPFCRSYFSIATVPWKSIFVHDVKSAYSFARPCNICPVASQSESKLSRNPAISTA